mmetsp:Transcript_362/g.537  ORF Transcript_362/g.537 Transcript_362/m.537 type:complete len:87 (-) Transcript_362:2014-2274(-)
MRQAEPKPKNSLTHGDIANMKMKLRQNRDKINKIDSLQRKLNYLKHKIDESNEVDPGFKQLFVKSMLPMLTERSKEVKVMQSVPSM